MLSLRALFRVYPQNYPSSTQKLQKSSARALYSSSRSPAKVKYFASEVEVETSIRRISRTAIEGGETHQAQSEANPESSSALSTFERGPHVPKAAAILRRPRAEVARSSGD
jgi:hypothetical protein